MLGRHTLYKIRRFVIAPFRPVPKTPVNPEFLQANAVAGTEPLRPELSGLRLRPALTPRPLARRLVDLKYRWQPSSEYRRRQTEMREVNRWLKCQPRRQVPLPPIFAYIEETDVSPTRLKPWIRGEEQEQHSPTATALPAYDRDLEEAARLHGVRLLQPRIPALDREDVLGERPLLPRKYREFLRHSPYPRLAAGIVAGTLTILSVLWFSQLQQAEAVAAGRFHRVQNAFQRELAGVRSYGVDPRALQALALRSHALRTAQAPVGPLSGRARVRFYGAQEHAYRSLLRSVRSLERRALRYWTWREGVAYAALVEATGDANNAGLQEALPAIPPCETPACYRTAVAAQTARTDWLRQTAATLHVYAAAVATSADPAITAGDELQKARSLQAVLPASAPSPIRTASLDGMYATAAGPAGYARVGALAQLDVDALQADLVRTLPGRAVVVSTGDQEVTCYQQGRAVFRSPVTSGSDTPTGIFHVQAKQSSLPALYWSLSGRSFRYRYGALPDWMPFDGQAALQAAPWRTVFGPGSDAFQPGYAPSTPESVDLPPSAAGFLFSWVSVGTEVIVY